MLDFLYIYLLFLIGKVFYLKVFLNENLMMVLFIGDKNNFIGNKYEYKVVFNFKLIKDFN